MGRGRGKKAFATAFSDEFFDKLNKYAKDTRLKKNYIIEEAVTVYIEKNPPKSNTA